LRAERNDTAIIDIYDLMNPLFSEEDDFTVIAFDTAY
jgi:hypothetical protein